MSIKPRDNHPNLWQSRLPWPPARDGHKYDRGHAVMAGGKTLTGAIRMAAQAAMRIGAGLCTVSAPRALLTAYTAAAPHLLFEAVESLDGFVASLQDTRRNAVLMGPGMGRNEPEMLRHAVLDVLKLERATVLDADAITVFEARRERLEAALHDRSVLTPHGGEFSRVFGPTGTDDRVERVMAAAQSCGCTVLLKGAETIIAAPGQVPVINKYASPWLATAGAGDVLAGMITGLLAQGMVPFEATCAAVWMHGDAARRVGPGLVAPDLINSLPAVMRDFS